MRAVHHVVVVDQVPAPAAVWEQPPSRGPRAPNVTLDLDDAALPSHGLCGPPEAPRFTDRPDLSSSVQLMAPAFRGSATPSGLQQARRVASPLLQQSPEQEAFAAVPSQSSGGHRMLTRRVDGQFAGVTPLGVASMAVGSAFTCGPPTTPKHLDRPDMSSSMQMMSASFRGSAAPMAIRMATPTGVAAGYLAGAVWQPSTPSGSSGWQPSTPSGLVRRVVVTPLAAAPFEPTAHAAVYLATPTNADRKIMLARSSRSIRGNVLAARTQPDAEPAEQPAGAGTAMGPSLSAASHRPPLATVAEPASEATSRSPELRRKASSPTLTSVPLAQESASGRAPVMWGSLATPKNSERPDLACSLSMGTAAFRGSGVPVGWPHQVVGSHAVGTPSGVFVSGRTPAAGTPLGVRCFPRT